MNILENPFHLLKATPRDRKARLVELSDELALHGDQGLAADARNALSNPRNRLAAEIAWFPGLSPKRVELLVGQILQRGVPTVDGLSALCAANLTAAALPFRAARGADDLRKAIEALSSQVEGLDVDEVMSAINDDRQASGLPALTDAAIVEEELSARRRFYQREVMTLLDELPTETMVQMFEALISEGTCDGEIEADVLINDLLDQYEIRAGEFLSDESERIKGVIDEIEEASDKHAPAARIRAGVVYIIGALKTWDRVAQPIQVSKKAKGLNHDASVDLAFHARSLAIHLFNEHDYLEDSQLLSKALQELFAEVAAVSDHVDEDVETLKGFQVSRAEAAAREKQSQQELAREITYETTFGVIFKDTFRISPAGIEYKGYVAPLDKIVGVSWGSVRHSTNGIPTGTSYHVKWRANGATTEIQPDAKQFSEIICRLWKGVCIELLVKMMEAWGKGQSIRIGDVEIRNDGVVLTKPHVFSADEQRFFKWSEMTKGSGNGVLAFYGRSDRNFTAALSYKDTLNTHILDFAVDRIWEGKASKLSEIFKS